ncbi:type VI secretion system protein TssA [Xenorhabdus sp. PB61.4]|uniref:type VI secretion system protein TssA n=1 Tax=Xenorhabdus sp. PB61.4 TaxID=2788940 RepID=UPI001E3C44B4|nr:type VI secretion system protein TssA [Xenorhabdus sp. PB61.4]MCC8366072.1 type VI secretion system protein TssA [Xenorhabdus sp. PB61.4]
MSLLDTLCHSCFGDDHTKSDELAQKQIAIWEKWLIPITAEQPVGNDPGYDDDFERMREEVNKLSGADTELICQLAEKLLTTVCKDVRVATYYLWARLHREGEEGFADGLALLAGLLMKFGDSLLPSRPNSRKAALEWLSGNRVLDSLSLYPEVGKPEFERIIALLRFMTNQLETWDENNRPLFGKLYSALESRLMQSGGWNAVVPQNISASSSHDIGLATGAKSGPSIAVQPIQSGRELLDQAKSLAHYLRNQPQGWLSAHRLMKSVRWDTIHQCPPQDTQGCTRLAPPRTDARAQLKRLYMQQSWGELLEQADRLFAEGVNHFWLDVQWYLYQALSKSGAPWDGWADIIKQDLKLLLRRLPGLEKLAWNDGTPFADDVTASWIMQKVLDEGKGWSDPSISPGVVVEEDDILSLEAEAIAQADSDGLEKAMAWLQSRPAVTTPRQRWMMRLLMSRVAEQFGRNDLALHLLSELDTTAGTLTLVQWEPELAFEIKARRLQLLRAKSQRNSTDKTVMAQQLDELLAELVRLDPVRSVVLYG